MHNPTLSFMYRLDTAGVEDASALEVTVGDTSTISQAFRTTAPNEWVQSWVDLSLWAGQTVTLTFALHQAAWEPLVQVQLDDISVGSWLTPVITDINPRIVRDYAGNTITITGENFFPGSTVYVGGVSIATQYLDEHTIQITLPDDLPIGWQDIWIDNPGGQNTIEENAILIGWLTYLPGLWR
jgi:hypothetical protein